MDNGEFDVSSEINTVDTESVDFNRELHEMEQKISYYKLKLQNCRDRYERAEMEIQNVRQLQRDALFTLNSTRMEEENLHKSLENLHLTYETCVEKSGGYEDLDEMVYAKINELTMQKNTLMEELAQMRKNADDNGKKLARVNAMVTEQEEKNASLLRELKRKSENVASIPQDIREQIDTVLKHLKINNSDNATSNIAQ